MTKVEKIFVLLMFFSNFFLSAQTGSIKIEGKVVDAVTGEDLPGATVQIKAENKGTVTDANGSFTLAVRKLPASIEVSYLGYLTEEIDVYESSQPVVIALQENASALSEVVVVGYGTQKRKELTGSIVSVPKDALAQLSTSFETILGGAIPGLNVTQSSGQPGAAYNIRIRGGNSVTGGNEPLYVIDGVIIYDDAASSSTSTGISRISPRLNPLASINPGDIESIDILKDVSATAIYGSRGSNGVIIITTKSGKKGRNNIEYQYTAGWQQASKKIDLLDAKEWAKLNQEIYPVTDSDKGEYFGWTQEQLNALGKGTDWQSTALRTAPTQNHQLTVSGGDEKTRYFISGNFTDQDGIILNTNFKRYAGRFNFERNLFRNFTVGLVANAGKLIQNGLADYGGLETGSAANSLGYVILIPQTVPIYNADGTFNYNNVHEWGDLRYGNRTVNAISDLVNTVSQNINNSVTGTFFADWDILPSLKAKVSAGLNLVNATQNFFGPSSSAAGFLAKGYGSVGNRRTDSWQYEYTLNYNKLFNKVHYVNLLAGYTTQTTDSERTLVASSNFSNETLSYHNLQASEGLIAPTTSASKSILNSLLGRLNYTFNNKYNLTATLRADGSSRFAEGHKWGYFPSVGLSWNVEKESFLEDVKAIDGLKFRVSAGTVGNQEIGDYRFLNTYNTLKYSFSNNIVIGYVKGNRENPDLKWETTSSYNAGIDLGLHKRFNIVADIYYKKTSDLLLNIPVEITSGYYTQLKNVGSLTNKGIEFEATGLLVDTKALTWNLSANIAKNINTVTNVALENGYVISGNTILQEGEEYGSFYGLKFGGIAQKTDDRNGDGVITAGESGIPIPQRNSDGTVLPGDVTYIDQNGDNVIDLDNDRVVLGSSQPDFIYGFSTTVRYRAVSLFAAFHGNHGNKILNSLRQRLERPDPSYNASATLLGRWTETNPSNTIPKAVVSAVTDLDSRYVEDASFLKLRTLSLNYILPVRLSAAPSTRFALSATAQNLLTLTGYSGYDPEVASGTDSGVYPTSRNFTFGIKISY
ncbi:MAG: TonB-dependent receptor [Tannerella sp.]|jgi:TonB-linked SusC/RagA family outer membrane protein|nr:TonB-dependent receptor [Tannerella sp.]